MLSLRKQIVISIVLLTICFLVYVWPEHVQRGSETFEVVSRIDAGSNRSVTVLTDTQPFETPAWYYEIDQGSQRIVRTCFLRCCLGNSFQLLTSRDQSVVGLVWREQPDVLLMAYDFNPPQRSGTPGDELSCERAMNGILAARNKLQADNPQLNLKLP